MDNLTPGQREVIALALLHGWRWEEMYPDCRPVLTNVVPDERGCAKCRKTKNINQFSNNSSTICRTCYRRKARRDYHKKYSHS